MINNVTIQKITDKIKDNTVITDEIRATALFIDIASAKDLHKFIVNIHISNLKIIGIKTVTIDIITKTPIPDLSTTKLPLIVL